MVNKSIPVEEKRRGRPPGAVYAEPIPVRLTEDQVAALDAWRSARPDSPSRSQAIRDLLDKGLSHSGQSRSGQATAARSRADDSANAEMKDMDASADEKSRRRRSLTDEPAAVTKARGKRGPGPG